jgi:hypothetical protein
MPEIETKSSIDTSEPYHSEEIQPGPGDFPGSVSEADVWNALEFAWEILEMDPGSMSLDRLRKLTIGWMWLQARIKNSA